MLGWEGLHGIQQTPFNLSINYALHRLLTAVVPGANLAYLPGMAPIILSFTYILECRSLQLQSLYLLVT